MNDQLILHHNEKEQCIIVVNIFFGVIPLYPVANITAIEPRKIFQKFIFAFFFSYELVYDKETVLSTKVSLICFIGMKALSEPQKNLQF